jgi:phage tail sheath gpL-like
MPVNTGINAALLRPQTFHVLTYLRAGRALVPLPQRLCLIGAQSAAATAIAQVVVECDDPTQTDALFGLGSTLALMCRKAFACAAMQGQGPQIFACPLAETTTKRAGTFTITGPATADDNLIFRIAGRWYTVGVANGTTATNIGVAVDNAIKANYQDSAYTSGNAAGVVTITAVEKGVLHNDTIVDVVHVPPGVTCVFAQTIAGAGVLDLQPALDAIAGQQFDGIAICNHASADITEINTHLATTWAASEKKPRWFFIGEPGTIGTAVALAANHEGIVIGSMEQSRSMPYEIATALAVGALSKSRPNANYDGMQLPLYPPPIAFDYMTSEVETALNAGLTAFKSVIDPVAQTVVDGVVSVTRLITTRTTINALPFILLRDFGVSRTAWAMAKQYDIAYVAKFGSTGANPDGVLLSEDTIQLIRDMVIGINKAAEDNTWLHNVDFDTQKLVVEADANAIGRINVDTSYTIVVGLHQVAFIHRAQL